MALDPAWNDVTDARLTEGKLWLPADSFDLMRRDWGIFDRGFAYLHDSSGATAGTGSWIDMIGPVYIALPTTWEYDDGFESEFRVYLDALALFTGGTPGVTLFGVQYRCNIVYDGTIYYGDGTDTITARSGDTYIVGDWCTLDNIIPNTYMEVYLQASWSTYNVEMRRLSSDVETTITILGVTASYKFSYYDPSCIIQINMGT